MDPKALFAGDIDFEALVESLHDGVYCVDRQMRIVYWNRAAELSTGYPRAEVVGSRCSDNILCHVDEAGRSLCRTGCLLQRTLRDGESRELEAYLKTKAGHRMPVRIRSAPLRDRAGALLGAVEVFSEDSAQRAQARRIADLEKLALLDALTGLPNRRFLEATLAQREQELFREGWPFGVLMADIDHFKAVNDRHGHAAGDRVLVAVAQTLAQCSRLFDQVGRWGGEEFLVVLSHVTREQLLAVAERLRAVVATCEVPSESGPIAVHISVGAALAEPGQTAAQVVAQADGRLYEAKGAGRNRVAG